MSSLTRRALAWAFIVIGLLPTALVHAQDAVPVRVKDIAVVQGVRENQLVGIGLVTGLAGKGDSNNSLVTKTAIAHLLEAFGLRIAVDDIRSKNTAVVTVSSRLPAFSAPGDRLSVHVASLGDATDLSGGVLLQTNLKAANGNAYAVAQGTVSTDATGGNGRTVGVIPGGAIVEREVGNDLFADDAVVLVLHEADFTTANAVASSIRSAFPEASVRAVNSALVEVLMDSAAAGDPVQFVSQIEQLSVVPDVPARVVINEKSGVVVLGGNVRIGPVGISYRNNDLRVQPVSVYTSDTQHAFMVEPTATVSDFVQLLQDLDVATDTIIEILKLIEKAGALYGTLLVE